tara:strand:+ start:210 stop:830 length:621 start_codon:yes stop_codon:yes gene_type:complete
MAGNSLLEENLDFSLTFFSKLLNKEEIEHFVFFGTLLGLTRHGKPIKGDDDIDFYVNKKDYDKVCKALLSIGININHNIWPNHTKNFIQVNDEIDKKEIRVDFYFYDSISDKDYLIEPWNFNGLAPNVTSVKTFLKIPKIFIYPLSIKIYLGEKIFIPKHSEVVCEFLYGQSWKIPKSKGIDYKTIVIGGKPIHFSKNEGNITLHN